MLAEGTQVILLGLATLLSFRSMLAVALKLKGARSPLGHLFNNTGFWAASAVSNSVGPIIYIFHKFPRDASATSLGPTLWESVLW